MTGDTRRQPGRLRTSLKVSEVGANAIIAVDRSTVRYCANRLYHVVLRGRLLELAEQRGRFGYRRLHVLPRSWTPARALPF